MQFMSDFPARMRRPLVPNGRRRASWHDYRSRSIYLITLNAGAGISSFSQLTGTPGDHHYPPRAVNTPLGELIAANISALKSYFPFCKILRRVIMPDHIHLVIFIEEATGIHLGDIINHLKKECYRQFHAATQTETTPAPLFEDGYNDRILMKKGQLKRMLNYVSDNPRRRLLRLMFPGFFHRHLISVSLGDGEIEHEAYGNISLLSDPDIEPVRISSRYSPERLRERKICWKRTVENCGVLVSPFISPAEKKVYDWAINNGGRIIYITDNGLGERFTPKGIQHQLCSEGRLLIIAPRHHSYAKKKLTREICLRMNDLALAIASGKTRTIN